MCVLSRVTEKYNIDYTFICNHIIYFAIDELNKQQTTFADTYCEITEKR